MLGISLFEVLCIFTVLVNMVAKKENSGFNNLYYVVPLTRYIWNGLHLNKNLSIYAVIIHFNVLVYKKVEATTLVYFGVHAKKQGKCTRPQIENCPIFTRVVDFGCKGNVDDLNAKPFCIPRISGLTSFATRLLCIWSGLFFMNRTRYIISLY